MKTAVMFRLSCVQIGERIPILNSSFSDSQPNPSGLLPPDGSASPVVIGSRLSSFVSIAPCTTYRYYVMICDSCIPRKLVVNRGWNVVKTIDLVYCVALRLVYYYCYYYCFRTCDEWSRFSASTFPSLCSPKWNRYFNMSHVLLTHSIWPWLY